MIDSREDGDVPKSFANLEIPYTVQQLPVGDVVYGKTCIERKAVPDFFGSCLSGHMFEQIKNMEANFERNYVIIVGDFWEDLSPVKAMHSLHSRVKFCLGNVARIERGSMASVLMVGNNWQFANLCKYLTEGEDRELPDVVRLKKKKEDVYISMLIGIPGVGSKTAKEVQEHWNNMGHLCSASSEDLQSAVGNKTGKRIWRALHEQ